MPPLTADIDMVLLNWFTNLAVPIAILVLILGIVFWKIILPQSNAHVMTVTKVGDTVEKMGGAVEKIGTSIEGSSTILKMLADGIQQSQTEIKEIRDRQDGFRAYFEREFPSLCRLKEKE